MNASLHKREMINGFELDMKKVLCFYYNYTYMLQLYNYYSS